MLHINLKEAPGIPYMTLEMLDGGLAHGDTEMCDNLRTKVRKYGCWLLIQCED